MEDNSNTLAPQETPEVPPVMEMEVAPVSEEETSSPSPARSKKWLIIGGILIVFLAVAAFLGARLLKPQTTLQGDPGGKGLMMMGGGGKGGPGAKSVRLDLKPAKEVPQEKATTAGLFVRREDQSIFIGTGRVTMAIKKGPGGAEGQPSSSYDGPVVEVVINHETKVYQDITDFTPPDQAANGGTITMQQVVKPGSLDDIGSNSMISVWGDKQGDRYIAKVITFR